MLHLIIGNTGSGKTTYANQLKIKTDGILFSIDTWNKTLFLPDKKSTDGLEWFLERIDRAESIIMDLILQLENSNTDTILDLGFSKYEHREKFREFAKHHGFKLTTHFLDISKDTRWKRILKRNSEKGTTYEFEVTKENFDFMENWFEKPKDSEIKNGILTSD